MLVKESLRTRGIIVEVGFVPPLANFSKKTLIAFQTSVEEIIDISEIKKGEGFIFMISKGDGFDGEIQINLSREKLLMHILFPSGAIVELIEIFDSIIKILRDIIRPHIFAPVVVNIRKQVTTQEKDANLFFTESLFKFSKEREDILGRPIQTMGIKLMMPPFLGSSREQTDAIELKIETLNEDPRDIYLEINRVFSVPIPSANFTTVKDFILSTEDYLNNNVLDFISFK